MPPPTSTGYTRSRNSSIRPRSATWAARVAPPTAMSPSPGPALSRAISSAGPPDARRVLPRTSDSVEENTTFGSARQISANLTVEWSCAGFWSTVSQ